MAREIRVLVVEDEPLIAWDIESELGERGYEVVGPVGRVDAALALLAKQLISIAVLDINLGDSDSFEIARHLADKRVPFIFLSGDAGMSPDEFNGCPVLSKPIDFAALDQALIKQLDGD